MTKTSWHIATISYSGNVALVCPMFAPAYMGREWVFSNAFTPCTSIFALGSSLFARLVEAVEGAAPHLFRPMYADANMGHPSREEGFVLRSNCGADDKEKPLSIATGIDPPRFRLRAMHDI